MAGEGLSAGLELAWQHVQETPGIGEVDSRDYTLQAVINKKAKWEKKKKGWDLQSGLPGLPVSRAWGHWGAGRH